MSRVDDLGPDWKGDVNAGWMSPLVDDNDRFFDTIKGYPASAPEATRGTSLIGYTAEGGIL